MHITAANCVSSRLQRSQWLRWGLVCLYIFPSVVLFSSTILPLELSAFLLSLLIAEVHRRISDMDNREGEIQLHSSGHCLYQGEVYKVEKIALLSRYLIVLDLHAPQHRVRLPIAADAVSHSVFRHISRVCLSLKS